MTRFHVRSAADAPRDSFETIRDRYRTQPLLLMHALDAFTNEHPGHCRALAVLIGTCQHLEHDDRAHRLARRGIDVVVAAQQTPGPCPLPERRARLRLAAQATHAAVEAGDTRLTCRGVALLNDLAGCD